MLEAQRVMEMNGFRHLPVTKEGAIVGIISDRDLKLATVLAIDANKDQGSIPQYKLVSDYMTSPVLRASRETSVEEVTREMINLRVSSFIIQDNSGHDVGILTTEDLLIVLIDTLSVKNSILNKFFSFFSVFKNLRPFTKRDPSSNLKR